ncbi:acetylornithine transaminase [Oceanobacillus luteolus]|uniref:Acetylornithine aminotransferase n=1 Tax=Oceanobacillus luteolus TaxID=1274358 RepID=A0ABW4HTM1_9BACI|nr:acetylornithine transaminase [Oceanobacillus luteolus]MCM3739620.1 acetylornithine transaminase [Oceanobacillus luteolus]
MSNTIKTEQASAVMNTYGRFPLEIVKGKGSYVWNDEGNRFLDYTSGIATCNLGHVPEPVQAALKEQLDTLWHVSNLYHIPIQEKLAKLLTENSSLDAAFFCNSGAEANEAAIKIAKKYAKDQGNEARTEIVTFKQSFHGRTGTTLAATAQEKIHQGFTPITPGFRYLPYNDFDVLQEIDNGKTTAVLLELVQGEGGVNIADKAWLKELEKICKEKDILLMIDEVQTGIGRTGTLFAYEQFGIEPDVITLAKGLGSGFPIGSMLAKDGVAASFTPGTHGSTFGGNPLAMTAGYSTVQYILDADILDNVNKISQYFQEKLTELKSSYPAIIEIKGKGLLLGLEMEEGAIEYITALREENVLVLSAGEKVLRLLPPLTTTEEEIDEFIDAFKQVLNEK